MPDAFDAELHISPNTTSIAAVQRFFGSVCESLTIAEKTRYEVELAIEDGLIALFKNARVDASTGYTQVRLEFRSDAITVTAKVFGRPLDVKKLPSRNEPLHFLDEDTAGLGNFLINQVMDSVQWRYVEKQGQELVMVKNLPSPIELSDSREGFREPAEAPAVTGSISYRTVLGSDDALSLSICAYDIYRYAYKDVIYYPKELLDRIQSGRMQCWIAVDDSGTVFGHYAMMKRSSDDPIAEMGAAFVRPECRKDGMFSTLSELAHAEIRKTDLRGLYSLSITNHIGTQKTSERAGRRSVGIRFASTPAIFVEGARPGDRVTTVLNYCQLVERLPRRVFIPERHREIVLNSYDLLGIPVDSAPASGADKGENIVECHRDGTWNRALIDARGGNAACHKLRALTEVLVESQIACILLSIDLEDPQAPLLVEEAEKLGYFYSGIFPESLEGHDALQLQLLNGILVNPGEILLYQDSAKGIMNYIRKKAPYAFAGNED